MGTPLIDLSGLKFGKLTVIEKSKVRLGRRYVCWLCRCECGVEIVVRGDRLRDGHKKFCSRGNHPRPKLDIGRRLARKSWESAWARVTATTGKKWRNYGSRGITMCERWRDFEAFLTDMGPRPDVLHTLDRINNDGNYEPGNCRWTNKSEQRRNSRGAIWIEYEGERHRLSDFCEARGLSYSIVKGRISLGWPIELAISAPKGKHRKRLAAGLKSA